MIGVDKAGVTPAKTWHVTDENVEPMLMRAHKSNPDIAVVIDADEITQAAALGFVMNSYSKVGPGKFIMRSR